jgi:hypothetical protein
VQIQMYKLPVCVQTQMDKLLVCANTNWQITCMCANIPFQWRGTYPNVTVFRQIYLSRERGIRAMWLCHEPDKYEDLAYKLHTSGVL